MTRFAIMVYYLVTLVTTCGASLLYQYIFGSGDWERGLIVGLCFGLFWSIGTHLKAPDMIEKLYEEVTGNGVGERE